MNRVNKSIGWADYSVNPVKGKCPVGCSYCYMWGSHGIGKRFHLNQRLRYDASAWLGIGNLQKPSRIFVGSSIELFHPRTKHYLKYIFLELEQSFRETPEHRFLFLTKCPENLPTEWPDNCWVGCTATDAKMADKAGWYLQQVKAPVRFLSIEPLLEPMQLYFYGLDWLIIGQQTPVSKKTQPKIESVQEIVEAADQAGIKVFLKDNLKPLIEQAGYAKASWAATEWVQCKYPVLRQEMPT